MGSDLYMNPPQLTREEREKAAAKVSQEESLAQDEFKKWYAVNVSAYDDPFSILSSWKAFWAGYQYHKNLSAGFEYSKARYG